MLYRYSLQYGYREKKTHKEETDPSNRLIFIKEIELITNNFPKQKPPGPDDFSGELYQIFKEEMTPLFYNLFQKILTETPYLNLQGQHCSDTKTRHKHYKEGKLQTNISYKYRCRYSQRNQQSNLVIY